jgi:hypothetical protein
MHRKAKIATLLIALSFWTIGAFGQAAVVSEKKDVAVFALGYYGWNLPLEALGTIDQGIQKVFADLGRFRVIGLSQRLSSPGLEQFVEAIKKSKEAGFVLPEKYQFGEATLTEADFNRLLGAFIVATPVITLFDSRWEADTARFRTAITTSVSFLDVAAGSLIAVASVETTGYDALDQVASMRQAIDAIPSGLEYQVRSLPAFQISTRILQVGRGEVKIQLGADMGIKKGDEYAVTRTNILEGIKDEVEVGLVLVKEVGPATSTGVVLYADTALQPRDQLREIARVGIDVEPFLHLLLAPSFALAPGLRLVETRGFYGLKPLAFAELPIGAATDQSGRAALPLGFGLGGQYDIHLGRLGLRPWAAAGLAYAHLGSGVSGTGQAENVISHFGIEAWFQLSWLASRDLRYFAEAGAEYWFGLRGLSSFGGVGLGGGLAFKL